LRPRVRRSYHRGVARRDEAQPTLEDLEAERERLKRLELKLSAEWKRVRAEAAAEIETMKSALRASAERAAEHEREVEVLRQRLEKRAARGDRLSAARARLVEARAHREEQREVAPAPPPETPAVLAEQARSLAERGAVLERRD